MAAINTNVFIAVQKPVAYTAVATAANTDFDAPTQVVALIPPGDNTQGMRLTKLYAITRADPTSAVNCQVYKTIGSAHTLIDSALLADAVPSATVANQKVDFGISDDNPLFLHPAEGLSVAIGVLIADGVSFRAEGGSYTPLT